MRGRTRVLVAFGLLALVSGGCEDLSRRHSGIPGMNPLEAELRSPVSVAPQEGIAAVVLVDTSGSMKENVTDALGRPVRKIEAARKCVTVLVEKMSEFAKQHAERKLLVGIYEFSARDFGPSCRPVVALGAPDAGLTAAALNGMVPDGNTPIGDAMIRAKLDLDATGMTRRHILVVTDGENNRGYEPGDVAEVLSREPSESRVPVYFVAFDIEARRFNAVKEAGGLVLAASNEADLGRTLDFILTGKILAEQPLEPAARQ